MPNWVTIKPGNQGGATPSGSGDSQGGKWKTIVPPTATVVTPEATPLDTFKRFTGAILGFSKDIAVGGVQAGVKLGLSIGEIPRQVFRNPLKEPEPVNLGVSVFGKEIKSVQRSTFERNVAFDRGEINMKQYMGGAGQDVLDLAQFIPGVAPAARVGKVFQQGVKQAGKNILKSAGVGAGYGAGYGATGAMQEDRPWAEVKDSAIQGAKVGAVAGGVLSGAAVGLSKYVSSRRAKTAPKVEPQTKKTEVKAPEVKATALPKPKGTMADIQTGKEPFVSLKPREVNPDKPFIQDIKSPERKESNVPRGTSEIDDIIKRSKDIDYKEVDGVTTPEGKGANGRARFDHKTGKGYIEVKKGASDSTKAHEFGHVINSKYGESHKLSTEIEEFSTGKRKNMPKAIDDYLVRKGIKEEKQRRVIAQNMALQVREAAKLGQSTTFTPKNSSEAFSMAFSRVLTDPDNAKKTAPDFYAFVNDAVGKKEGVKPSLYGRVQLKMNRADMPSVKAFGESVVRKGGKFEVKGDVAEVTPKGKKKIVFEISDKAKRKDFNQMVGELKSKMDEKPSNKKEAQQSQNKPLEASKASNSSIKNPEPKNESKIPVKVDTRTVEGTGKTQTRGLARGVEAKAVEKKLTEGFGDLPDYQKVSMKDQAERAYKLLDENPEYAKRIALGSERPPEGLLPESVFLAVENDAIQRGDVETLRQLATQSTRIDEATTMGQRLRVLAERNEDSAVVNIQKIKKEREAAFEKKSGTTVEKAKKEALSELKEKVKAAAPKKEEWNNFINEIEC